MKKIWILLVLLCAFAALFGCGKKITLHCDRCGREVQFPADSGMTENWIVVCPECQKELYP